MRSAILLLILEVAGITTATELVYMGCCNKKNWGAWKQYSSHICCVTGGVYVDKISDKIFYNQCAIPNENGNVAKYNECCRLIGVGKGTPDWTACDAP